MTTKNPNLLTSDSDFIQTWIMGTANKIIDRNAPVILDNLETRLINLESKFAEHIFLAVFITVVLIMIVWLFKKGMKKEK